MARISVDDGEELLDLRFVTLQHLQEGPGVMNQEARDAEPCVLSAGTFEDLPELVVCG